MNLFIRKTAFVLAAAATSAAWIAPGPARADEEEKLDEAHVPKAVVAAVKRKYPAAQVVGYEKESEDGKVKYEASIKDKGRAIDVDVSQEGKIMAEEMRINPAELPDAVRKGLGASKYGKWTVKGAERIITDEKADAPTFEIVVESKGKRMEVVLDAAGKITKEEPKSEHEAD